MRQSIYKKLVSSNNNEFVIETFYQKSLRSQHPFIDISVPDGYKLLGGGAVAERINHGGLLTASYPVNTKTWRAKSKDHSVPGRHYPESHFVEGYAIAIFDPNDIFEVKIVSATSGQASHPMAVANLPSDYCITGGGAFDDWGTNPNHGNLLTCNYPDGQNRWIAKGKDHGYPSPAKITSYIIGIKSKDPGIKVLSNVFVQSFGPSQHNHGTKNVTEDWTLTGGGVRANWSAMGGIITHCAPNSGVNWLGITKDFEYGELHTMDVAAIGLKIYQTKNEKN